MSNKLFQNVIHQMKDSIDRQFGVIDKYNKIIACSEKSQIGKNLNVPIGASTEIFVHGDYTLKPILQANNVQYTLFIKGNDFICNKYAHIIAVAFVNIKKYHDEKYDRARFVKDIILDNILPGDIYIKARDLCFDNYATRIAIVVRSGEMYDMSLDVALQDIFPDNYKDFIININENEAAIVKEINEDISPENILNLAESILATLLDEYGISVTVGIGSAVNNIKSLSRSFKEAQMSLEVGKVFDNEKSILSYDNLGVARLVYQLPTTLCDVYLSEILKHGTIDIQPCARLQTQ